MRRRRTPLVLAAAAAVASILALGAAPAGALPPVDSVAEVYAEIDLQPSAAEFDAALEAPPRDSGAIVLAHAGQVSPKDDCHRQKSAGERHWHWPGSSDRGGPCVKRDGATTYILELEEPLREKPRAAVPPPWEACTAEWYAVREELSGFWQIGLDEDVHALMDCLRLAYPRE